MKKLFCFFVSCHHTESKEKLFILTNKNFLRKDGLKKKTGKLNHKMGQTKNRPFDVFARAGKFSFSLVFCVRENVNAIADRNCGFANLLYFETCQNAS